MKLYFLAALLACLVSLVPHTSFAESAWPGVDETVVERVATEAGRPPRAPYINTDRGDLLPFLFLLAGTAGGFIAGYTFRGLFSRLEGDRTPDASLR